MCGPRIIVMIRPMSQGPLHQVCIGLGANLGDRAASLRAACEALSHYIQIEAKSPIYETAPVYASDQPTFLNAALKGQTSLDPTKLLYTIKDLERELGRMPTFRFGPRLIDIDILFFDDLEVATSELTIPHPQLCERIFVLQPLADIAPDWVHPVAKVTVRKLLDLLPSKMGAWPSKETL